MYFKQWMHQLFASWMVKSTKILLVLSYSFIAHIRITYNSVYRL